LNQPFALSTGQILFTKSNNLKGLDHQFSTKMDDSKKLRYAEIIEQIKTANHEYHVVARPSLTDDEYDRLVREAKLLEKELDATDASLVLAQVGAPSQGAKVKHLRPMLSLDNIFTPDELRKFFKTDYDAIWEPKVDGLSLSLIYDEGRLKRATTRGDGKEGDDVTHNAQVVLTIPQTIQFLGPLEVRGEVYISKLDFLELVKEMEADGDEPFANARNAAAGSLKLKDSVEASKRKLSFIAYHAFGLQVSDQIMMIAHLTENGFVTTNPMVIRPSEVNDDTMTSINALRLRLPYDTDGVVFKINKLKIREELGSGSKSPKWAVAYKFPPEEGITVLKDVQLQVGRTGTINPVAIMKPVLLNGAWVSRSSLCNYDEIARLDIAIGDEVVVVRAAEVIPKVIRVHKKSDQRVAITPPEICPVCKAPTKKDPDRVAYVCVNRIGCKAQATERIAHAVHKTSLDWDGFGISQVDEFIERGFTTLSSIFAIEDVSWMKPAARKKFLAERERAKIAPLWRKLHAMGFDGIGKSFCQELAFKYGNIVAIAEDFDGVSNIVGPNRAKKLYAQIDAMLDEIENLDALGFKFEEQPKIETAQTQATGKSFVITGSLETGTREAVAEKIEKAGGVVKSSVSKTVDYLVVGNEPGNGKTAAAAKHGTKIISEEDLYTLLGQDFTVASNPLDAVNMDDL
jgi:DNA ligase (NAD+)